MMLTIFVIICLVWVAWWFIDYLRLLARVITTNKEEWDKVFGFIGGSVFLTVVFGAVVWVLVSNV